MLNDREKPDPQRNVQGRLCGSTFEDALAEEDDYDLLVMGRTQEKAAVSTW